MSDYDRYASPRPGAGYARSGAVVDQGLRSYMIGVYNYMTLGLGVTGLVAWAAFAFGTVQTETGRLALTAIFLACVGFAAFMRKPTGAPGGGGH